MAPHELGELRARVERLEREVERLHRLSAIQPGPPPVAQRPPVQEVHFEPSKGPEVLGERIWRERPVEEPRKASPQAATPKVDAEFKFGSTVLPRAGIALLLLGLTILVAIGIQRGFITLTVQFVGEIALCGLLIGLGVWRLNEREDFGQVLVGGGSCGLYLSFAGAHVYKDLITGESVVALFTLLSLANLGFSWWRSSKTFWVIGFLGGLVAAGLPLDRDKTTAALVLAGLIVIPAVLLAGRRRWLKAIAGLWLCSTTFVFIVAHIALSDRSMSQEAAMAVFCAFSLVPIAAHAWRFVPSTFDPVNWFGAWAVAATGLAMLSFGQVLTPVPHSLAQLLWGVGAIAVALPLRDKQEGRTILMSAVVTATVLAPIAFTPFMACLTYFGLALAASFSAHAKVKGAEKASIVTSGFYVVLSLVAYGVAGLAMAAWQELAMLAAIAIGMGNVTFLAGRLTQKMGDAVLLGGLLIYPLLARGGYVSYAPAAVFSATFVTSAYALLLAAAATRAKWPQVGAFALLLTMVTTLVLWQSPIEELTVGRQVYLFALNTAAIVLAALAMGTQKTARHGAMVVAAMFAAFSFVPMTALVFGMPSLQDPTGPTWVGALVFYAVALSVVARSIDARGVAIVGTLVSIVATAFFVDGVHRNVVPLWTQIALLAFLTGSFAANAHSSSNSDSERQGAWFVAGAFGWYSVGRVIALLLGEAGMGADSANQTAWAVYATVLGLAAVKVRWSILSWLGAFVTLVTVVSYWNEISRSYSSTTLLEELVTLGAATAAIVVCTLFSAKDRLGSQVARVLAAVTGWFVLARAFYLLLEEAGMESQGALTASWTLYAALVLTLGFVLKEKPLRMTSLALFGVTIAKVFLIDLAELDDLIKVIVLVLLGFVLIAGGYIYVRLRQAADAKAT